MDDILRGAASDRASYPLWMLFSVKQLKQTGELAKSLPIYRTNEGVAFAAVFTDKDLAQRWVEENPLETEPCELLPLESFDRLRQMLKLYQMMGVESVGTDFSSREFGQPNRRGQMRTIAVFLQEGDG